MSLSWSNKKETSGPREPPGPTDAPDPTRTPDPLPGDEALEFQQLTGHLEKLRELFDQANRRIADYLVRRESRSASAPKTEGESPVAGEQVWRDLVAGIRDAVRASVEQGVPAAVQSAVHELSGSVQGLAADLPRHWSALDNSIQQVREQLQQGVERLADLLAGPSAEPAAEPPVSSSDWERAILGAALAADPALASQRQQLLAGVLAGDAGACALAGQLLIFHSAPAERLPPLLKDLGEAYYRWQPKTTPGSSPMEESLVRWLRQNCEAAGIYNAIELVHPGERFDSTRHAANTRGVEITEVLGWIVLRDNGKVYTKASVVVR